GQLQTLLSRRHTPIRGWQGRSLLISPKAFFHADVHEPIHNTCTSLQPAAVAVLRGAICPLWCANSFLPCLAGLAWTDSCRNWCCHSRSPLPADRHRTGCSISRVLIRPQPPVNHHCSWLRAGGCRRAEPIVWSPAYRAIYCCIRGGFADLLADR